MSSVPIINVMSQRSRYELITTDRGGGGGTAGSKRNSGGGIKAVNPNWDPRYQLDTALGAKIQKLQMRATM